MSTSQNQVPTFLDKIRVLVSKTFNIDQQGKTGPITSSDDSSPVISNIGGMKDSIMNNNDNSVSNGSDTHNNNQNNVVEFNPAQNNNNQNANNSYQSNQYNNNSPITNSIPQTPDYVLTQEALDPITGIYYHYRKEDKAFFYNFNNEFSNSWESTNGYYDPNTNTLFFSEPNTNRMKPIIANALIESTEAPNDGTSSHTSESSAFTASVIYITTPSDCPYMIQQMQSSSFLIVNMENIIEETIFSTCRDMMKGAVYALDYKISHISHENIFMVVPGYVQINVKSPPEQKSNHGWAKPSSYANNNINSNITNNNRRSTRRNNSIDTNNAVFSTTENDNSFEGRGGYGRKNAYISK